LFAERNGTVSVSNEEDVMLLAGLSKWMVLALMAQAPAEEAWLKSVPADVELVVRLKPLEETRKDLVAMAKAMSPMWGGLAEQAIQAPFAQLVEHIGKEAAERPMVVLGRIPGPDDAGTPPMAVLVLGGTYAEVLKTLKATDPKPAAEGIEAFMVPDAPVELFAGKGKGFVAVGPSKEMVASLLNPSGKTLDGTISGRQKTVFMAGEAGIYLNAAVLIGRFQDQIVQAKEALIGAMDQAAVQQGQTAAMIEFTKSFYGGMFDGIKDIQGFSLSLDASEQGLEVASIMTMKPGSDAAKGSVPSEAAGAALAKLADDAGIYGAMDIDSSTLEKFQTMSLKMLSSKPSPGLEKASTKLQKLGNVSSAGAVAFDKGMKFFSVVKVKDPAAYIAACEDLSLAMGKTAGGAGFYKEVTVTKDGKSVEGWKFEQIHLVMDKEKVAELNAGNPAGTANMQAMFGGDTLDYWYGTDGKSVIQLSGTSWNDVETKVKAYISGSHAVGKTAAFQAARAKLPEDANVVFLVSAQSMLKMFATQYAALRGANGDIGLPATMPKAPVYLGLSLTTDPKAGYEFHLVIPSSLGAVIEKGVIPFWQANQGGVKQ
jgi:hypothetical protein